MEEELTQEELDERIAILKRFRSLLEMQRAKFNEYLKVLELQEQSISLEDAEAIFAHSELENQIVSNIASLQKVIVPMEKLYRTSNAATYNPLESKPVSTIQQELESLKLQVQNQNQKNQDLLRMHMTELRQQLGSLRNPYKYNRSVYAESVVAGSLMNIEA